ncbi:MAG TPA: hypothetical protein VGI99_11970 [Gemmataceae bacterium]|jgi:hypothetical protein
MAVKEISNSQAADNSPTDPSGCEWGKKLDTMRALRRGWNGYDAEPPSALAIATATGYLDQLASEQFAPARVAPSVVGGVGVTCRNGDRRVYVEFYNDGRVHALFAHGEDAETTPVDPTTAGFHNLLIRAREYLDA